jgi:hypothetical protein
MCHSVFKIATLHVIKIVFFHLSKTRIHHRCHDIQRLQSFISDFSFLLRTSNHTSSLPLFALVVADSLVPMKRSGNGDADSV